VKKFREFSIIVFAFFLIALVGTISWERYVRSTLSQYEGKTADEWVDYFADRMIPNSGHYYTDDLRQKELEIVFRNFEAEDHARLVDEYLSMKTPGPLARRLLKLGEKVPLRWRIGPLRERYRTRLAVIGLIMKAVPPAWELLEPAVRAAEASGKTNQVLMRLVLAYVGEGASNAVPFVAAGLTNGMNPEWSITLQSLVALGTNVSAALPALISPTEQKRWISRHLSIFGNLGPMARDAVPTLEKHL
jgi:hypothetical protein